MPFPFQCAEYCSDCIVIMTAFTYARSLEDARLMLWRTNRWDISFEKFSPWMQRRIFRVCSIFFNLLIDSIKTDSYQTSISRLILSRVKESADLVIITSVWLVTTFRTVTVVPGRSTGVRTRLIRFVSIHPIATGIATASLWMKDCPQSWIWMEGDKWVFI